MFRFPKLVRSFVKTKGGLIGKADGARPRPVLAKSFELVGEWDEQEASQ